MIFTLCRPQSLSQVIVHFRWRGCRSLHYGTHWSTVIAICATESIHVNSIRLVKQPDHLTLSHAKRNKDQSDGITTLNGKVKCVWCSIQFFLVCFIYFHSCLTCTVHISDISPWWIKVHQKNLCVKLISFVRLKKKPSKIIVFFVHSKNSVEEKLIVNLLVIYTYTTFGQSQTLLVFLSCAFEIILIAIIIIIIIMGYEKNRLG